MSERNFIGKQLINIKDKMSGKSGPLVSAWQKTTDTRTAISENVENQPVVQKEPEQKQEVSKAPLLVKETIKEEVPPPNNLDKDYIKAINAKKEDYFKTKKVVAKMLGDSLTGLKKEVGVLKQREKEYSDSADAIEKLLEDISGIEEAKWNSEDFSIELSEAGRIVEKARLENIILKEKLNLKIMEESKNKNKSGLSALDIVSLSFHQVVRLGFVFFLPLIIGIIAAALIIALTILVSMGRL